MADEAIRRQLEVINPLGLHARPAALVVKLANQFQSDIELIRGEQRVDAKSVLHLMTLAAEQGTNLVLEARGQDAMLAADAIEQLFRQGLGDLEAPAVGP